MLTKSSPAGGGASIAVESELGFRRPAAKEAVCLLLLAIENCLREGLVVVETPARDLTVGLRRRCGVKRRDTVELTRMRARVDRFIRSTLCVFV